MKNQELSFELQFLQRFSVRPVLILLTGSFVLGVIFGTVIVKLSYLPYDHAIWTLFFSGAPLPEAGFLQCFSATLLNILTALIAMFLLGVTAFGALGIPLLMFCRGASTAAFLISLLAGGGISDLGRFALCSTPAAAAGSLLIILFAVRAMSFSWGLARAGFSQRQEVLNFQLYFKDLMYFLCFSVAVSVIGSLLALISQLF